MRLAALAVLLAAAPALAATPPKPENLARKAKASASTEYSANYLAKFATDGVVPEPLGHDDVDRAWAVKGDKERNGAWFKLEWPEAVKAAEIVYYARTGWFLEEGWKDYEVRFDDQPAVVAKGTLAMDPSPQRIKLPPSMVKKIDLKFVSSYGGLNPGMSEVEVYAESPPKEALSKLPHQASLQEESPELAKAVQEGKLGFDRLVTVERRELNPSHVYTNCAEGFGPGGGLYVLSPPTPDGRLTKLVDSPKGQIMDCDVSFDGREILFSWRREGNEGYHLWRVDADGSGLTQLTSGECHDYNACWLPDGGIAFISTRAAIVPLCWTTPAGALFRMDRDGHVESLRRLSANYVNDFTPSVLLDGRILYSRWEYVDKPAIPIQSLWTIFPNGTNLSVYYGNGVLSPASKLEGRAIPGSTAILCTLTAHNGPIRGAVGRIDRNHGLDAQASITNLTPQVNIGRVYQGDGNGVRGPFENPCPIDDERFLVSNRGSIVVGSLSGGWAVVRPRGTTLGLYNPQPLRPRPRPPQVESYSENRPEGEATVYIMDIYQGLLPHVPRGSVRWIAIVQELAKSIRTGVLGFGFQRPVISCGATYAPKRVWGFVPVEADGSAYFRVPTGVPLYFLALDENGMAVQRMRSFTHFVPGERRGCIGCHEPRNTTPPAPLLSSPAAPPSGLAPSSNSSFVIRHSSFPTGPALALNQPPRAIEPPEWGNEHFDYARIVQPVFDKHCTKCHSGPEAPKRIDLSGDRTDWFNVSYDNLTHGYVSWISTMNGSEANILQITPKFWGSPASKLSKIILSGHPDKDGKPRVAMDVASRRRIFTWIDLNIPYYSSYEMAHPDAEGGRRILPKDLKATLAQVAARRCAECHNKGNVPQRHFIRITNPELNDFLVAPLAKAAGGRESCKRVVFESKQDPDYQAILKCFEPVTSLLAQRPRMDMPGAVPAKINSSCQ